MDSVLESIIELKDRYLTHSSSSSPNSDSFSNADKLSLKCLFSFKDNLLQIIQSQEFLSLFDDDSFYISKAHQLCPATEKSDDRMHSSVVLEPMDSSNFQEIQDIVANLNDLVRQCEPNAMSSLSAQTKLKRVLLFIHSFDNRLVQFLSSPEFHPFFPSGKLAVPAFLKHIRKHYPDFQIDHTARVAPFDVSSSSESTNNDNAMGNTQDTIVRKRVRVDENVGKNIKKMTKSQSQEVEAEKEDTDEYSFMNDFLAHKDDDDIVDVYQI